MLMEYILKALDQIRANESVQHCFPHGKAESGLWRVEKFWDRAVSSNKQHPIPKTVTPREQKCEKLTCL